MTKKVSKNKSKSKQAKKSREFDPVFEAAYEALKLAIGTKKFNAGTVMIFAVQGMQIVERYPQLSGPEKKQLVLDLVKKLVNDSSRLGEEEKASILLAIDMLLPAAIDQIIAASKGQLDLNKIIAKLKACFGNCHCGKKK